jgi:hypothetical protein
VKRAPIGRPLIRKAQSGRPMARRSTSTMLTCVAAALAAVATLSAGVDSARAGSLSGGRTTVTKGPAVNIGPGGPYGGRLPPRCGKSGICSGPPPRQGTAKPSSCQASGAVCTKQY